MADGYTIRHRVSSIPKLPDDELQEIITTVPTTMAVDHAKTLPPLPASLSGKTEDNSSITSSSSTSKSIMGTAMKSTPTWSTTATNVKSMEIQSKESPKSRSANMKLQKLQTDELESRDTETEPSSAGGVTSFFRSFTGYGTKSETPENESKTPTLDDGIHFETDSPTEMLTYRKVSINRGNRKHSRTISGASEPMSPQGSINTLSTPKVPSTPKTEINYNLYVDEKYLDTQYRYATEARNNDFHKLFEEVPANDRLLDDFSCALSREILLQGRIYISEHYLCFNSSLLGWITTLVISLDEIKKFERKATAGLFHNGIIVETREAKHVFASFISRDQTLNFIETVWSRSVSLSLQNNEKSREFESLYSKTSFEGLNNGAKLLTEDDLYTIDSGSSEHNHENGDYHDDVSIGEWNNDSASGVTMKSTVHKSRKTLKTRKVRPASSYRYDYDANKEAIMKEEEYQVSLGGLFDIMFGDDITFHKRSMEMNEGMNFTEYKGLHGEKEERNFEYDKKLNYPVGPSSTRVYVTEIVEHYDLDDYIEVINISKTPNVPSGGAFDCRTRFVLSWSANGSSKLIISYKLNWTGSSWIKGVIENSALSGQKKAASDMHELLLEYVPKKAEEEAEFGDIESSAGEIMEGSSPLVSDEATTSSVQKKESISHVEDVSHNEVKILEQLIELPFGKFKVSSIAIFLVLLSFLQLIVLLYLGYANLQLQKEIRQSLLLCNSY